MSLGAGIAWSVATNGDVVGDDRSAFKSAGRPTLWRRGQAIALSNLAGSAFGIADDGTIVGQLTIARL
jgi:hypothetical protein